MNLPLARPLSSSNHRVDFVYRPPEQIRRGARAGLMLLCVVSGLKAHAQNPVLPVPPIGGNVEEGTTAGVSVDGVARVSFDRSVQIRMGPLFVTPAIGAGMGVESVARAGSTNASLDARFFIDAGPSLDVVMPVGSRHLFSASGQALYRHFVGEVQGRTNPLNGWQYYAAGGYRYSATRFRWTTTYDVVRSQRGILEYLSRGGVVEETDVDGRINVVTQTAATQMSFDLSPRLNLNLGGAARRLAYGDGDTAPENELARRQDRDEILLSASLDRRMTLKTSLGLFAGLRRSDFQSASSFRDNDRFRGGLRVVFGERGTTLLNRTVQGGSEPLEGAIESGVEIIDLAAEGRDDFSGLFARGVLRFGVRPKLGVWAGGEARSTPTFWQNNTYAINRGVGTGVDFPLVAGVTAGLFVDYTRIRYPELATFTQDDGTIFTGIREDNLLLYRGLLSVPIFGTRIGITGGWFDRRSNFDIATNRGYFLRIGLGTSFAINERI